MVRIPDFPRKRLGIIGGLGALGAADVFFKLVQASPSAHGREQFDLMFEQRPFNEPLEAGSNEAALTARKLYVFDMVRHFEARHVDAVLLPCFISHTFLDEIASEIQVPILDVRAALLSHLQRDHAEARRIGVLTSDRVRQNRLFESAFSHAGLTVIQPTPDVQRESLMAAIYGAQGIKSGHVQGKSVDLLEAACRDLLAQGAEVIVPGFTEIPLVIEALRARGLPIVDSNRIYASHAVSNAGRTKTNAFKVGVVGGVGPAATADFLQKIVHNTHVARDQDHIKLVIEQNPQIPDRTSNLTSGGPDPTIALYATCKKLEASDADLIAIPCNTAHAFVERIQPYLSIPIVNMLDETVRHLRAEYPDCQRIGLLATSGTISSRVYHDAVEAAGLQLLLPDDLNQAHVMDAIFGEQGVKAGFLEGECRRNVLLALAYLVQKGAQAVILGCTELPLILSQSAMFPIAGTHVVLVDPTDILANKCVALAQGSVA